MLPLALLFAAFAWHAWGEQSTAWAVIYGGGGAGRLLSLPALWQQYQTVKAGGLIHVPPQQQTRLLLWAAVPVCILLTLLVGGISFVTALLLPALKGWEVWLAAGAVNVGLWLYVVHSWRRVLFPTPQPMQTVQYDEPQEGVWPPPPQRPQ